MKMCLTFGCVDGDVWQRLRSRDEWKVEETPTQLPTVPYMQLIIPSYTRRVHAKDNQSLPAAMQAAHSQGEKRSWVCLAWGTQQHHKFRNNRIQDILWLTTKAQISDCLTKRTTLVCNPVGSDRWNMDVLVDFMKTSMTPDALCHEGNHVLISC